MTRSFLVGILLLEVWLFSGSFGKFFNHDSIFYLLHAPRSLSDFGRMLAGPDAAMQYRPLPLGLAGLIVPHFGNNPRPYHFIPLAFHLANTLLFFLVARRLLRGAFGAVVATAFWGLHSVAGWITYDMTCVSDFLATFFLLLALFFAHRGTESQSRPQKCISLGMLALALFCKESATTFPLAMWITAAMAEFNRDQASQERGVLKAFVRTLPLALIAVSMALLMAGILIQWHSAGRLYAQGAGLAYDINPLHSPLLKQKYAYWALNLPDALQIPRAEPWRILAFGAMAALLLFCLRGWMIRRWRLEPMEWSGLLWLVGLNLPALLLAQRLAKWYLYAPLTGLALVIGALCSKATEARLERAPLRRPLAAAGCMLAMVLATSPQTRSYLASSDSVFVSNMLSSFQEDLSAMAPDLPSGMLLYFLPALDRRDDDHLRQIRRLFSVSPINHGEFFSLFYHRANVRMLFAHSGQKLPVNWATNPDLRIVQYLDGRMYDVTESFRAAGGRLQAFVLGTLEGKIPPRLENPGKEIRSGYEPFTELHIADAGGSLPEEPAQRNRYWILRYINGNFYDVTQYFRERRFSPGRRLAETLDRIRVVMDPLEYYPDRLRYATPSGQPFFHLTPDKDILTQIAGSTLSIPMGRIRAGARLHFEASWMYETGDGGWAELAVRVGNLEDRLFSHFFKPNSPGRGWSWQKMTVDLSPFAEENAELILRCYNEQGNDTVSDWLNWRLITIEEPLEAVKASRESGAAQPALATRP